MDEWRLRILKLIQYSCSLSAVGLLSSAALASAGPSLSSVTLSKQLDKVASLISLSRRSMRLGDWIEGISDLKDALGGGGAGTASSKLKCLCAAASVLSDLAEDSVTCSKLRIFGVSKGFEQAVDGLWMMSLLLRLAELLREVHRPVEKRSTLSKRKRDVAYLRLAKVVVDLGQAVPDALGVDTPPVVDPLLGFTSSILGAAILWVHSSRAEDDDL